MPPRTRRRFLRQSAAGFAAAGLASVPAAAAPALSSLSQDRVAGSNRRVRVGLIGCGGMGTSDLRSMLRSGSQLVALCDVDDDQSAKARENFSKAFNQAPELVTRDFRRVLDRKDIDAVIVATPDHWHALADGDGVRGGQGRLRREASVAHDRRRAA